MRGRAWGLLAGAAAIAALGYRNRERILDMIDIKPGVLLTSLSGVALRVFDVVGRVYGDFGQRATLTSAEDGVHSPGSLHPHKRAWDFRLVNIPDTLHRAIRAAVAERLGREYQVLYEYPGAPKTASTWPAAVVHLHVEYDPK